MNITHASAARPRGFILLPVVLALTLIASAAAIVNRDTGSNVAMVADRSDRDKARYAAEAGLQHANYVVQQRSCGGTYPQAGLAPVVNGAFGGASYTAHADRASGSPVQITATGTYNGASVRLVRPNVIVYQAAVQNYVVQPDTATGKDTHVSPLAPTTNYGAETSLRLATNAHQPLLQFSFGLLPTGSRPVPLYDTFTGTLTPGAQLSLYQTQTSSGAWSANAQLVNRSWTAGKGPGGAPGGATWNSADGTAAWSAPGQGYEASPVATLANTNTIGWQNWDVTDAAAAWISNAVPNFGLWLLSSGTGSVDVRYTSSDELLNLAQRPKLTLNYLLPCGTLAPKRVTLGPVIDTEIDRDRPNHDLSTKVQIGLQGMSSSNQSRVLALFDLSSIPTSSVIGAASLRFFVSGIVPTLTTTSLPLEVRAMVTQSWTEDASWNDRTKTSSTTNKAWNPDKGGTFLPAIVTTTTLPAGYAAGNWIEFAVGTLVQEWVSGAQPNLGLVILTAPSNDRLLLNSREALSNPPQLVVTYR